MEKQIISKIKKDGYCDISWLIGLDIITLRHYKKSRDVFLIQWNEQYFYSTEISMVWLANNNHKMYRLLELAKVI